MAAPLALTNLHFTHLNTCTHTHTHIQFRTRVVWMDTLLRRVVVVVVVEVAVHARLCWVGSEEEARGRGVCCSWWCVTRSQALGTPHSQPTTHAAARQSLPLTRHTLLSGAVPAGPSAAWEGLEGRGAVARLCQKKRRRRRRKWMG